jgi:hypothetical protein
LFINEKLNSPSLIPNDTAITAATNWPNSLTIGLIVFISYKQLW